MKKALAGCLLFVLSGASHAGCHDLLLGQHSWHADDTYEDDGKQHHYDNANYLLGCVTDEGHVAAVFENSYSNTAVLVGHRWQYNSWSEYVSPYLVLGVATGYKDHMAHVGAFSPYGFVGVDIHPADNSYGLMISTVGSVTSVGMRFALE